jgi:hypothetical protein
MQEQSTTFVRVVGDDTKNADFVRSAFINPALVSAVIDGDRCVTIHVGATSVTLATLNPPRHARDLIDIITNHRELPDTIIFSVDADRDEQRASRTVGQQA